MRFLLLLTILSVQLFSSIEYFALKILSIKIARLKLMLILVGLIVTKEHYPQIGTINTP